MKDSLAVCVWCVCVVSDKQKEKSKRVKELFKPGRSLER